MLDHEIKCPEYSAVFNYRNSEMKTPPAYINLKTYLAQVAGGRAWIRIS